MERNILDRPAPAMAWFSYGRTTLPTGMKYIDHKVIMINPVHAESWDFQMLEVFVQYLDRSFGAWYTKESIRFTHGEETVLEMWVPKENRNIITVRMYRFHPALFKVHYTRTAAQGDARARVNKRTTHYFSPVSDLRTLPNVPLQKVFNLWYMRQLPEECREQLLSQQIQKCFSKSAYERYLRAIGKRDNLGQLVEASHGTASIGYMETDKETFMQELRGMSHRFCWVDNDEFRILKEYVWKAPWADAAWKGCDYVELDASFYSFRPYVFCIPQVVIHNTALPIGISIGPGETADLYQRFYDLLSDDAKNNETEEEKKFCLTDEGSALQSFCEPHFRHVLCHRHVLQGFGSSPLAVVVNLLITAINQEQFNERVALANEVVELLLADDPQLANLDQYEEIAGFKHNKDGGWEEFESPYQKKVLLFWRETVARCANHVAGIHRSCKELANGHGKQYGFLRTLHAITEYIYDLRSRMEERANRNIREAFDKIAEDYVDGECSCTGPREMQRRWNCMEPWPCVHTDPEQRKEQVDNFARTVCNSIKAFKDQLHDHNSAPTYTSFAYAPDGPEIAQQEGFEKAPIDEDLPDSSLPNSRLNDHEKVSIILAKWFLPTLQIDRDQLMFQCAMFVTAKDYREVTGEALVATYNYVTRLRKRN